MTIKEYNEKVKKIDKKIEEKRKKLSAELDILNKERFELTEEFNKQYQQCYSDSCLFLVKGKPDWKFGSRRNSCGEYFKKSEFLKVVIRRIESLCTYEDEWNSGGNEYQIAYTEREYTLCPKCKSLHSENNVYNVIKRFKKDYYGHDTQIGNDMKKHEIDYPTEVWIYKQNKLVDHFYDGEKVK